MCWILRPHEWETYQYIFLTDGDHGTLEPKKEVIICWKQCRRCAKSKLIHILK